MLSPRQFYAFSANLSSTTSISSFTVQITLTSGDVEPYDNNGAGYPVQDSVIFQSPQSCLDGTQLTVTAAVSPNPTNSRSSLDYIGYNELSDFKSCGITDY